MSTSATPDSVRSEITENALKVGNPVKTAAGAAGTASSLIYEDSSSNLATAAMTASKPVYINSSSVPTTGAFPFSVGIGRADSTSGSFMTLTGYSSLSGVNDLGLTLVAGGTASFTIVGFTRVSLVDSGGNITTGDYYMPYGTLA